MCCGGNPSGRSCPRRTRWSARYRLIAALHPTGFPVARPYGLCEDPQVIGAPFYIMEMVEGRTLWDGRAAGHGAGGADRALRGDRRHARGAPQCGSRRRGPGRLRQAGAIISSARSRAGRSNIGRARPTICPEVEAMIAWLPRTVPEQTRTSIVHGDFRIDNMIFAADRPSIRAVLDWELSTLGDPLADFSYFLMSWATEPEGRSGVKGLTGPESGIPTLEAVVARYCAATGRDGVPDLDWYFAYNLFRWWGSSRGSRSGSSTAMPRRRRRRRRSSGCRGWWRRPGASRCGRGRDEHGSFRFTRRREDSCSRRGAEDAEIVPGRASVAPCRRRAACMIRIDAQDR